MAQKAASKRSKGKTHGSGAKTVKPKLPTEFIVRPHEDIDDVKLMANIYVSPALIEISEWKVGEFIRISKGLASFDAVLSTWDEDKGSKYGLNVVLLSPYYLKLAGFLLGDRVGLSSVKEQPAYAYNVVVDYLSESMEESDVSKQLCGIGLLYKGLTTANLKVVDITENVEGQLSKLSLNDKVAGGEEAKSALQPFLFHPTNTTVQSTAREKIEPLMPRFSYEDIGGLKKEISSLRKNIFLPLNCPGVFKEFGIQPPRGILLYGPSGTGKSLLLKTIAYESSKCHIIKINGPSIVSKYLGGTEETLRGFFKEAVKYSPAIILIDEIDSLVPSRSNDDTTEVDSRVVATLLTLLDGLEGPIVVIGATNRPGAIDSSLRRPGRFDQELEIGIPDADGRYDILVKQISRMQGRSVLTEDQIRTVANKTHGYVGADLVSLTREAVMRCIKSQFGVFNDADLADNAFDNVRLGYEELLDALKEVRPSAMREIVLEMPKVRWSDIGGQEVLKRKLKEMVQLPLTAADTFKRLGISAPKGLLLYGPPGCSKTMTAKALATESGLNFIAIKGPEIFNKYVGESEKKIREIFRKARMAAPSIIFIDEIDALATSRESADSGHVTKQVLNTLLNEIDGVEELKGVIIVGATNRPDAIDPALLRPGRLDRHVYVSPPDQEARRQIFDKNTSKFNLQDKDALLSKLVNMTDGFSGSECVLLCQEAGLNAIMSDNNCKNVSESNFIAAIGDISKNITPEMIHYYQDFAQKYRACSV